MARTKLPRPRTDGVPMNPAEPMNWKNIEPKTREQMDAWLEDEKALILAYLFYFQPLADDADTRRRISNAQETVDEEWNKWESHSEVTTGEFYDLGVEHMMYTAMTSASTELVAVHNAKINGYTPKELSEYYIHAQSLWEDFLYYQNAWNRPRTNDVEDARGPRPEFNPTKMTRARKSNQHHAPQWRENMIRLFNKWGIGDRSRLTKPIGPDQLHVYPDSIRHTVKHTARRATLREQFPVSKVRLDEDAIVAKREKVNQKRREKERADRDTVDRSMYAIKQKLPQYHKPYLSITERSNPWQYKDRRVRTSWESERWGHIVANKQRVFSEEKLSDRPAFKMIMAPVAIEEEGTLLGPFNNRIPDRENGGWLRGPVVNVDERKIWRLDRQDQHMPSKYHYFDRPIYVPEGTVTAVHKKNGQYTARREAYPHTALEKYCGTDYPDELSDVEDEEDYLSDHVSLSDFSDEEILDTDPPDSSDDESDDEGDLFTLAYRGLDADDNHSSDLPPPGPDGGDGGKPADDDGQDDDNDQDDDHDQDPKPGGRRTTIKKRVFEALQGEEESEDGENDKGPCRYFTYRRRHADGSTFTQHDEIPAEDLTAEQHLDNEGEPYRLVFPKNPSIPVSNKKQYANIPWTLGTDGAYHRDDLTWRPCMLLRQFRRDTGEYCGRSNVTEQFDRVISTNFSPQSVQNYNKRVRQYVNRNDAQVLETITRQPRWTTEEMNQAARFLNDFVARRGLLYMLDNWKTKVIPEATVALDKYREETMGEAPRGQDSIRTKFTGGRAAGLTRKLQHVEKRNAQLTGRKLRPKNFFSMEDFNSGKGAKSCKAGGRVVKGKRTARGKYETAESTAESDADGDEDAEEERDRSEEETDRLRARKRRKR